MKRFDSPSHMLDVHEWMFGAVGRQCAELVLKWAPTLFAVPLDPLSLRVVAAPAEMGPYNRHTGYVATDAGLILLNRHLCELSGDDVSVVPAKEAWQRGYELADFIVHELTHVRQAQLLREGGIKVNPSRGAHRDEGWYSAIAEAAPKYLGAECPRDRWPLAKSKRRGKKVTKEWQTGRLSEVFLTHWPHSFRERLHYADSMLAECFPDGIPDDPTELRVA